MSENHEREAMYAPGTKVTLSLPDPDGPDGKYDGRNATVISVEFDELGAIEGDDTLDEMYTLEFDNGEQPGVFFRVHDLEPVGE